jgi:hypothetical protein
MGAKEARTHDDGQDDPDNPIIPYRMSDRLQNNRTELKVNIIVTVTLALTTLVGAGMVLHLA